MGKRNNETDVKDIDWQMWITEKHAGINYILSGHELFRKIKKRELVSGKCTAPVVPI